MSTKLTELREEGTLSHAGAHIILIFASLVFVFPFFWALMTSLKAPDMIFAAPMRLIPADPTLHNYQRVLTELPFDRWILNSLIITGGVVFVTVLLDALAGFALAKGDFWGRHNIYLLVVGMLVIPPQVVVVPLFIEMNAIGWNNTFWGIMILYIANPFGVFMMRQYFITVPDELLEAARMDGCNILQIFHRIMLPAAKPALASLAVFTFVFTWSAFFWPLIITASQPMFPLQVGLGLLRGPYTTEWGMILSSALLGSAPVLIAYLFAQRTFMEGITLQGR